MQTGHSYIPQGRIRSYRFGFNGQEKDNEIYGDGNCYTADYWQYDPRLGRRWNVDPMTGSFPHQSPYCAFDNNPIYYTDPTGMAAEGNGGGDDEAKKITSTKSGTASSLTKQVTNNQRYANMKPHTSVGVLPNTNNSNSSGTSTGTTSTTNSNSAGNPTISALDNNGVGENIGSPQTEIGVGVVQFAAQTTETAIVQDLTDAGYRTGTNGKIYQLPKLSNGNYRNVGNQSFTTKWAGNTPTSMGSKMFRGLGKTVGVIGYGVAVVSTYYDYNDATNGDISWNRFGYRTTGTVSSIGIGAAVGTEFGPGYGTLVGTGVGASFVAGEMLYDITDWWGAKTSELNTRWENSFTSGKWWYGPAK